ncbi:MAG TPA: ATP-binding protein [Mesorhizobium sp.]|jgi:light-regulated signal transduction histidine kinase (bacteriophytochrome)|nr:ATP-binding protein [Mesorhizobium sp.]
MEAIARGVDLATCDQEAIHIPGSIQPHGVLFLVDEHFRIVQASANAARVSRQTSEGPLGKPLPEILAPGAEAILDALEGVEDGPPQSLGLCNLNGTPFSALSHRSAGQLVLEFEQVAAEQASRDAFYPEIRAFIEALQATRSFEELSRLVVRQARKVTGFDRVMLYQFDRDWNGTVVAEDLGGALPSYLDLRFPASDIPAQARELYRLNRLRLIPDANYTPVPIRPTLNPATGKPIDLSFSALRSVSPVHVEYMKNMGTLASMSVSVLREGRLWGLISCHSRAPHHVSPAARSTCDLLAQIFAAQAAAQEQMRETAHRVELQSVQTRLLARMSAEENFAEGLIGHPDELMHVAGAYGAAVVLGDFCRTVGAAPGEAEVRAVADWLRERQKEVFATDRLPAVMPEAARFKDTASGLLAVSVSKLHAGYVLWFRPEVIRTVRWGGDPNKPVEPEAGNLRLHPRKSFEAWKETVRERAVPWRESEIETATELRNAILGIVLRKAEELADLAQELARSNKELEAFSYSVSHDLRAPFRHIVGFAELLRDAGPEPLGPERQRYLQIITEAALSAGRLVDDLLNYSQIGRSSTLHVRVDMNRLVAEVRRILMPEWRDRDIEWVVADLPPTQGDPGMLRQAWQNLLSNAIKYTRKAERARIEVGSEILPHETVFFVKDNGVGFDMAYVGKLFGVFQRLHRVEEFEGTGIGLANVRRIAERHDGRAWAEGKPGEGAAFFLALPRDEGKV